MTQHQGCVHCIPDRNSKCEPILVSHLFAEGPNNTEIHAVDKTHIERDLRFSYSLNRNDHILVIDRERVKSTNAPSRYQENLTPVFKSREISVNITHCPKCGRQLSDDIPTDHPLLNR